MERWMAELDQLLRLVLGKPSSVLEQGAIVVVAALALLWVLSRAGSAFGMSNTSVFHGVVAGVVGVAVVLAAMTAARVYAPADAGSAAVIWIMIGAGLAASVVVVVPFMCFLQKSGYFPSLLTWLVSVGAAAAMVVLVGAAFDLVSSGEKSADKTRERRDTIENMMSE